MFIPIAASAARHCLFTLVIIVATLLAACGGGPPPDATPQMAMEALRARAAAAPQGASTSRSAADQLMDFGEANFAAYFPGHQASVEAQLGGDTVLFRFYPATGNYLGVVVAGGTVLQLGHVYVMGNSFAPFSEPVLVGPLTSFLTPVTDLFRLELGLPTLSVMPGGRVITPLTLRRNGTFMGDVQLQAPEAPSGVAAQFDSTSLTDSRTLTVDVPQGMAAGRYTVTIRGRAQDDAQQQAVVQLELLVVARTVGAYYYPHWGDPTAVGGGLRLAWPQATYTPTIGTYDANDPNAVDQHIKQAMAHGVTLLVPSFYEARLQGMLQAKYLPNIRFAPMIGLSQVGGFLDPRNLPAVLDHMHQGFFGHPSYFTIDGKPVLFLVDIDGPPPGLTPADMRQAFVNGREYYRAKYGRDVLLVGVLVPGPGTPRDDNLLPLPGSKDVEIASGLDAVTFYGLAPAYAQCAMVQGKCEFRTQFSTLASAFPVAYQRLTTALQGTGTHVLPNVMPGFNNRVLYQNGVDGFFIDQSGGADGTAFRALLNTMQPLMQPPWNLMLVTAWNEFSEGSVLEPSLEFGTSYLEQVRPFALGQDLSPVRSEVLQRH